MKRLPIFLALALCGGCVSYRHTSPGGDQTSFRAFLIKGDASKVATHTAIRDSFGTNYDRTVSIGALKGESDVDKLATLAEAVARGLATGANPVKK